MGTADRSPDAGTWEETLGAVAAALDEHRVDGWLTGGCVRDTLLGLPVADVDLVIAGDARAVVEMLPSGLLRGVGALRRDTVRLVFHAPGAPLLDISTLRGATLADDLAARDFTIDAMALPLTNWRALLPADWQAGAVPPRAPLPGLIDPLGGLADLRGRTLRLASPAAFDYDPGRILRAARFIARFALRATPATEAAARTAAASLSTLSLGRLREELNPLFASPRLAVGMSWLRTIGALQIVFPWLEATPTGISATGAADRSLSALAAIATLCPDEPASRGALATLAALPALRDRYAQPLPGGTPRFVALVWGLLASAASAQNHFPSPATVASLPAIVPGGQIRAIAAAIVRHGQAARTLLADEQPELAAIRRFFALEPGEDGLAVDTLVAACALDVARDRSQPIVRAADVTNGAPTIAECAGTRRAAELIVAYYADPRRFVPPPLLTGADVLRALPHVRGPQIRRILRAVRGAQLDGQIATRAEALALARRLSTT